MTPKPGTGLHPIETASRDELTALQVERLRWSVKHAYDNVEQYKKKFNEVGIHPDDIRDLSRYRGAVVHRINRHREAVINGLVV